MKKSTITLSCLLFFAVQTLFATKITIVTVGTTYSPATVNAAIGDTISIGASVNHPTVQVDQTTWNANGTTPLGSGWGTKTTTYTFTISSTATIYYVCANHVSMGMKGIINVTSVGISGANASYNINLFPNPATNGEFTVKAEGYTGNNGKIMIYDTEGKLVDTYNLTTAETSIKTKLPSGVYFYNIIINQKQVYRGKFLISLNK